MTVTKTEAPVIAALPPMLTRNQVVALTGLSYTSLWKMMKRNQFPLAINVAPGNGVRNMWDSREILSWWEDQRANGRRQRLDYKTAEQRAHTRGKTAGA
jgi:predicted DNA-binding transcriptional regulator AlpA